MSANQPIVIPLHPRTAKAIAANQEDVLWQEIKNNNLIKIIEPVSFLDMIRLESECNLIITDSGGVQKESYFFKKPCVILRNETEWVELVDQGLNKLVGCNDILIKDALCDFPQSGIDIKNIYGDGTTVYQILARVLKNED